MTSGGAIQQQAQGRLTSFLVDNKDLPMNNALLLVQILEGLGDLHNNVS